MWLVVVPIAVSLTLPYVSEIASSEIHWLGFLLFGGPPAVFALYFFPQGWRRLLAFILSNLYFSGAAIFLEIVVHVTSYALGLQLFPDRDFGEAGAAKLVLNLGIPLALVSAASLYFLMRIAKMYELVSSCEKV